VDYAQAIILGLIQGVTELFPVSSLGHSVILPQLFGWTSVVAAQSASESFYLVWLASMWPPRLPLPSSIGTSGSASSGA
jgi:undecaprenyl pyrophosphate phosphatase UppP